MRVLIAFGGKIDEVEAKSVDVSLEATFVKITDIDDVVIETAPQNVLIIHDNEEGSNE